MRTHGRRSTYNAGCRCDDCRHAAALGRARTPSRRSTTSRLAYGTPIGAPLPWSERAACCDEPTSVFFPETGGPGAYDTAKAICASCPVVADCLAFALRTCQHAGCWGGLTPDERIELRRRETVA